VATSDNAGWVANIDDGTVSRIDPSTNAVTDTVKVGTNPTGVAVFGGAVWVASSRDGTVSRVAPV
jgi:YVTN family beta-propeller protein